MVPVSAIAPRHVVITVAVADVLEAMSSHRPYRESLGLESALAELEAGAGTRYDAAVVAACVAQVRAGNVAS